MKVLNILILFILILIIGCAFKVETKINDSSYWFETDWYSSIEYCENECSIYQQYETIITNPNINYTPLCVCMNQCTDEKINIKTDTTYCQSSQ